MSLSLVEKYNKMLEVAGKPAKDTRVSVTEALTTADANILIPRVISQVMLEAAEPVYLASQFFHTVNITEGRSMEFINFGAIRAFDIPEGGEYPNQQLGFHTAEGGYTTNVKVGKVGLKVQITDEMVSDSQWDVIGLHLKAAGRAMARKKEEKIFEEFNKHGHVVYDADDYNEGDDGYPTGRGWDGTLNGTLSAQDLIDMCTSIIAAGFTPTDIIMHPLCWSLFSEHDLIKTSVAAFGGGYGPVDATFRAEGTYNLPVQGLRLQFSPYIPFDEVNKKYSFFIVDRNNVGVILQKDGMSTEQFDDPLRDIQTLKVKERYGVGILHGGLGIAVARNIKFARTFPAPERFWNPASGFDMPADYKTTMVTKMDELPPKHVQ